MNNSNNVNLIESIYNKHREVQYNEKYIYIDGKKIHIEMQGKITCPVLNKKISSFTCSKLMEQKGWPRSIDSNICDKAYCKIYKSIQKNLANRYDKRKKVK